MDVQETKFGRLAAAIDALEDRANSRVGGWTDGLSEMLRGLERDLGALRPVTADDWAWVARRLARALENGWHGGAVKPLMRLAG